MSLRRRIASRSLLSAAVAGILAASISSTPAPAGAASIGQLNSQLTAQQARQRTLAGSLNRLAKLINSLDSQISLVQSREAAVRSELAHDRAALASDHAALVRERARLARLRAELARARALLARQLVSGYESDRPDLLTVVLDARGFTDLLEKFDFLHRAQRQQQSLISVTQAAKARAAAAARRLARLEARDRRITEATALQARALAGMNELLQSKQAALAQAQAAQQAALAASRARGRRLESEIARVKAQQEAAARAAARASLTADSSGTPTSSGPALGPSGGWAIPYAIVLCESGGQNLPPNAAGASGYYQIMRATWQMSGGTGPAAYLAGKAEQDAVASRIWAGGAGASNWVCAGIVGIH